VLALAGLVVAALLTEPWLTLVGICVVYLAMIPVGMIAYARVKRRARIAAAAGGGDDGAGLPSA
jgi:CDP-diacylglycerol---serine O-phosphatidyltransferase